MDDSKNRWMGLLAGLMSLVLSASAFSAQDRKEIIFGTPPTQSVEKAIALYGPLAEYLTQAAGATVKLVPAGSFVEYSNKMRKGEYDLIFDGPHFVSWRMKKLNHIPIARLPGELVFVVVTKEDSKVKNIKELVGKKICGIASPNLATLSILDQFSNPVRQPIIIAIKSFKESMACVKEGKAEAGVMPIKFWKKFEKAKKVDGLKILYTTKENPLPPRTFSISSDVNVAIRHKITGALLDSEGKPGAKPVLDRFRSKNFVEAKPKAYKGLDRLLREVWGFGE